MCRVPSPGHPSNPMRGERLSALRDGVRRRDVWAWAMYDVANSGYTTVVITAVFNVYFVSVVAGDAPWATFAWTAALSVSYALVFLTAPVVGAYADARAAKKRLLVYSTLGCVVTTALLYFAGPETIALGIVCLILSNLFYATGENLIAAFLPELADRHGVGRVSGWGWGLGYLGGMLTLGLCLLWIDWAQRQGHDASDEVPETMLMTAGVFLLASLPTLLILPERAPAWHTEKGIAQLWQQAWQTVIATLKEARAFPDLWRFLSAAVCYQAGVYVVITLAAVYAEQALGMSMNAIIMLIFVVNIAAAAGALGFGPIQDRLGHVRAIVVLLLGWLIALALAALARSSTAFWGAAMLAGLCLGSIQSATRAFVAVLSPPSRRGEFFGFWGQATKLSAVLGPLGYGVTTWASGGNHRLALWIASLWFIVGLILILGVRADRGHRAALQAERRWYRAHRDRS